MRSEKTLFEMRKVEKCDYKLRKKIRTVFIFQCSPYIAAFEADEKGLKRLQLHLCNKSTLSFKV